MPTVRLERRIESGIFEWPWASPQGLLVMRGGAGGGGGGGGSFCIDGLTIYGAGGGGGGGGGGATSVTCKQETWQAGGGNGGTGGGGGTLHEGTFVRGAQGIGCLHGDGGDGGKGGKALPAKRRLWSGGGDGGKGYPGETLIVELDDLSIGDRFEVTVGIGGEGGDGGLGYKLGVAGKMGAHGSVLFVPLLEAALGEE